MDHPTGIGRRRFIAGGLAGAVVGATRSRLSFAGTATPEAQALHKGSVIARSLGRTGLEVPIVGMGCVNTLETALIRRSFEIGVRFFDTAGGYARGMNEEMLGRAMKEVGARGQFIICTKIFPDVQTPDAEQIKRALITRTEESLRRLQTDYVDVLCFHGADEVEYLTLPGVIEGLRALKEQGKARFIGFSAHRNMEKCIRAAIPLRAFDVIVTSFNYAYCEDQELLSTLKAAADSGIGLIAMKTQCTQYVDRSYVRSKSQLKYYRGSIMHTAVLKWVLRHPFITAAIPGFSNYEQMEEDFSVAYDLEYTGTERRFLEERGVAYKMGYCLQCGKCSPTCARRADVASLMRVHLYATRYPNPTLARETLGRMAHGQGLELCATCDRCGVRCRNNVDVPRRIEELKLIYA